ncbi:MAG: alcohol dehydrogenase catalytic domain-containing protein [Candidatus Lokiarchaeota archaeon]|nr:alcohol dehydrogenase catalytic domain-containing protein [Candidatus Lokiarchaeota archaeon]
MKSLMKTARGAGNLEIRTISEPKPQNDEVLVKVEAAGICGTDVHIKHDQAFHTPPVVLGHEYSGTVVDIGSEVSTIQVGDEVVSPATAYCGQCHQCKTGHVNRCTAPNKRILGVSRANGAFAQYLTVPEYIIHKVPDSVPLEEAALAEPTACVVHALIEKSPICPGDVVVVQGPGTMGLLSLQVAKAMGAGKVIVTGMSSDRWRLDIAERTGADRTIDIEKEDPIDIVNDESLGIGADVVVEASGSCAACSQALEFVKVAGHVALLGVRGRPAEVDLDQMIVKELTMTGTWGTIPSSWVTTLKLMASRKIAVAPLITHRLSLDEWEQGFELMEDQKAIKVLFTNFS